MATTESQCDKAKNSNEARNEPKEKTPIHLMPSVFLHTKTEFRTKRNTTRRRHRLTFERLSENRKKNQLEGLSVR